MPIVILAETSYFPHVLKNLIFLFSISIAENILQKIRYCEKSYDKIFIQLVQRLNNLKSVTYFPIYDINFSGDKSIVSDIDNPGDQFPLFPSEEETLQVELEPRDVLFIPALWFHNMKVNSTH